MGAERRSFSLCGRLCLYTALGRTICPVPASTAEGGFGGLGKRPKEQPNRERAGQQDPREGPTVGLGLNL